MLLDLKWCWISSQFFEFNVLQFLVRSAKQMQIISREIIITHKKGNTSRKLWIITIHLLMKHHLYFNNLINTAFSFTEIFIYAYTSKYNHIIHNIRLRWSTFLQLSSEECKYLHICITCLSLDWVYYSKFKHLIRNAKSPMYY